MKRLVFLIPLVSMLSLVAPSTAALAVGGSTPPSGTIGPASGSSTQWDFDAVVGGGLGGTPLEVACAPGQCSKFALTVALPQLDATFYRNFVATLTFHCSWTNPASTDVDCFSFSPAGDETGPGKPDTSASGANFEDVVVNDPSSGVWNLEADAGVVTTPTPVHGVATLTIAPLGAVPLQVARAGDARFANYDFPVTTQSRDALMRPNGGEPSIGADLNTGNVMYMSGSQVTRLSFDQAKPPKATFTDVTPNHSVLNEDAILYQDNVDATHSRTFAVGLLLAGSYEGLSDDDGKSYMAAAAFSAGAGPDHETLGAGPYREANPPAHSYPHAVYYCAQTIVQDAYCGRSDDGGITFNEPATALWNGACTPLHGHVRVGPTGVVYVPNASCTDAKGNPRSGVAISKDNGNSFVVSTPPDSSPGSSDPSVAEGPGLTVYYGYQASNGHPMVAVSHDEGTTWAPSIDVGAFQDPGETEDGLPHGVQNTEFAEVITGDRGRAAYAFLGTGTQGGYQGANFPGTWYLFVSYTFDAGNTWRTVNATPNDPVQRGCVWNGGGSNPCRNMLDFNDITVDRAGHVLVAYTDGCTTDANYSCDKTRAINASSCLLSEGAPFTSSSTCTYGRLSAVVRQVCGKGLFAVSDPGFNESPDCIQAASTTTTTPLPVTTAPIPALPNTARRPPNYPLAPLGSAIAVLSGAALLTRRSRRSG
ncbi:MAG: sialidase family protein [Candidatus Dormibacteria bacterium]